MLIIRCSISFNENKVVLEMPKKLIIAVTNPLVCYLIIGVNYTRLLLINKLIFINIKFEISRETSYTYNDLTKSRKKIRPS